RSSSHLPHRSPSRIAIRLRPHPLPFPPCLSASSPLRRGMISSAQDSRCLSWHQTPSSQLRVESRQERSSHPQFSWAFLDGQPLCPARCLLSVLYQEAILRASSPP